MVKFFFIFFFAMMFMSLFTKAQLSENFNDGDFTNNPAWSGGTSDFVVNSSLQLQSNNTVANSNYFLSTPNSLATSAQWEMYIQIAFNPSSANYIDIYLTASASDLTLNTTTGYFVRIGNTNNEISLYRKDNGGLITKIIGIFFLIIPYVIYIIIKIIRKFIELRFNYKITGNCKG
jgi:hypothetical protein